MRRGTTPTHKFKLPFLSEDIEKAFVTYDQAGKTVVEKSKENAVFVDDTENESTIMSVVLTQAETLAMKDNERLSIQVRVLLKNGTACASNIVYTTVEKILKEYVIEND